jgi:hypothetical protein
MKMDAGTTENSKLVEDITFTADDLDLLRKSADIGRAMMFNARLRGKSPQEKSYEFAKDWAEGNHWNTKRTREWAKEIKKRLDQMRAIAAARVKAGPSRPGVSGSGR